MYAAELGKAVILREGQDLTIVGIGHLSLKALEAADLLAMEGINAEVIDLRTVKPWDVDTVSKSVEKTGHLVVADSAWVNGSVSGEIVSTIVVNNWDKGLKSAPVRVGLPNTPAPVASNLERIYYPNENTIFMAGRIATGKDSMNSQHKPSMNTPGMIVG
jgi:acetoin:2,6-dichlorophenolindophenol oxidoreductase subunit beta